jgi:uncharacterized protein (TIGR02231 family)
MNERLAILSAAAALVFGNTPAPAAAAQSTEAPAREASEAGRVAAVTLYPDRAAVRRTVRARLARGSWTLRVPGLPASADPGSLQAKVVSPPAGADAPRLEGVEYAALPRQDYATTPEGRALVEAVRDLRRRLERSGRERALLAGHDRLVDQVGIRPAPAGPDGVTQPIDLQAAARQVEAVAAEKRRIAEASRALTDEHDRLERELAAATRRLESQGGADPFDRAAVVSLAVPVDAEVELEVGYLVSGAGWEPAYAVRADGAPGNAELEYDALVTQGTGEDWTSVRLALSTAQPSAASAPPAIEPWFVDIEQPAAPEAMDGRADGAPEPMMAFAVAAEAAPAPEPSARARLEELSAAARVQDGGIAVTFELPRTVTLPSDAERRQRTRIAALAPAARFTYVAAPLLSEHAFLRGDLVNEGAFQLLPGTVQVFMGGEFIGESAMPSVAPGGECRLFFGPDRRLRVRREVLSRVTGSSGLFGGSTTTTWKDRILVDNGTGRDVRVEVYDRRPVSRHEKVECALRDPRPALSADPAYVEQRMPQGILRWDVSVPASARGPQALTLAWTVEVSHPTDLRITPVPD